MGHLFTYFIVSAFVYLCKQTFCKLYTLNSRIHGIKNLKFPEYYFYINANTQGHFKICFCVPVRNHFIFNELAEVNISPHHLKHLKYYHNFCAKTNRLKMNSKIFFVVLSTWFIKCLQSLQGQICSPCIYFWFKIFLCWSTCS